MKREKHSCEVKVVIKNNIRAIKTVWIFHWKLRQKQAKNHKIQLIKYFAYQDLRFATRKKILISFVT